MTSCVIPRSTPMPINSPKTKKDSSEIMRNFISNDSYLLFPKESLTKKPKGQCLNKKQVDSDVIAASIFIHIDVIDYVGKFTIFSYAGGRKIGKGGFETIEEAAKAVSETMETVKNQTEANVVYNEICIDSFEDEEKLPAKK